MAKNLYDIIGVPKDATPEEIKKAYRDKAKKLHTDKGEADSEEGMQELNKAWAILSVPGKRERYDETGDEDDNSFDRKFAELVQKIFIDCIIIEQRVNIEAIDLMDEFRKYQKAVRKQNEQRRDDITRQRDKLQKVNDRLKAKEENIIGKVILQNIAQMDGEITAINAGLKFLDDCLAAIDSYEYMYDKDLNKYASGRVTFFGMGVDIGGPGQWGGGA